MTSSFRGGLLAGFILGAASMALALLVQRSKPVPVTPPPPASANAPDLAAGIREENRFLRKKVAEMEQSRSAAAAATREVLRPTAETPAPLEVRDLFTKLAEAGIGAFTSPKWKETLDAVKASGRPAVDFLTNVLRTSNSATERFVAAALLEGAGEVAAVDPLAFALKHDRDDIVRRMASHALAVLGSPAAEEALRAATVEDTDWGVRVNSAYGLAKLQKEDGLRILRDSYESSQTPPEYRLPILGGLADVAAPSTAPLFRSILADTRDASYVLLSIGALAKMKDAQSIPVLEQIAQSTQPEMVKQAAAKAIEAIRR